MKQEKVAGIAVACKTLVLAIRTGEHTGKVRELVNTASGHQGVIKALHSAGVQRVCLQATGAYHLDLALALDAAGMALMVVNPTAAKRFAQALMTRTKSDAVDAGVLAQFAQTMPFQPWQRPALPALELRGCARRLAALTKACTQAKNQLHAARLVMLADMQAKQWVAQAGLDPRHATSGTSVNKKPHLSKAGNRYLPLALYKNRDDDCAAGVRCHHFARAAQCGQRVNEWGQAGGNSPPLTPRPRTTPRASCPRLVPTFARGIHALSTEYLRSAALP